MEAISSDSLPRSTALRPSRIVRLNGVIVQSDKTSWLGAWIIRPVEMLDLHLAGIGREIGSEPLPIHAGLDVELEDGRRFVVEQLFGTLRENFVNGLNWTPLRHLRGETTQAGMLRFRLSLFGRLIRTSSAKPSSP